MIVFNRNDGADIQEQLTYLNSLPQYKLFRLRAVREQMKTYDFGMRNVLLNLKNAPVITILFLILYYKKINTI